MPKKEINQETIAGWKTDADAIGIDMNTVWTQWTHGKAMVMALEMSPRAREHPEAIYLFAFVFKAVFDQVVLGIRRQVDKDTRAHSFRNFLLKLIQKPAVYSREECVATFVARANRWQLQEPWTARAASEGEMLYASVADASGNALDVVKIQEDLDRLIELAKELKDLADQHVAHNDREKGELSINIDQVDFAVTEVKRLMRKYTRLFDGGGAGEGAPALEEMLSLYRFAWLENEDAPPAHSSPRMSFR